MTSSDVLRYSQWPTLSLNYNLDIFKLFCKGYSATLPDSLSENILKCRSNGYSLRGRDLLTIFRFQTRCIKDSLKYRGAKLWNSVCYYEQEVGRSSLSNLKKHLLTRDYLRNLNLAYFPLLLLALYIPVFLLRSRNIYNFLFSNSNYIHITCDFPFFLLVA